MSEIKNISFHKTLTQNLPATSIAGSQEVHFLENGEIAVTKNDGTYQSFGRGSSLIDGTKQSDIDFKTTIIGQKVPDNSDAIIYENLTWGIGQPQHDVIYQGDQFSYIFEIDTLQSTGEPGAFVQENERLIFQITGKVSLYLSKNADNRDELVLRVGGNNHSHPIPDGVKTFGVSRINNDVVFTLGDVQTHYTQTQDMDDSTWRTLRLIATLTEKLSGSAKVRAYNRFLTPTQIAIEILDPKPTESVDNLERIQYIDVPQSDGKIKTYSLGVDNDIQKYFILAVGGQSNALGYDESIWLPEYTESNDTKRLKQLGFNGDDNLEIIDLTASAQNYQDMSNFGNGESRNKGTRGLHLPLANLILKSLPEDYGLLILPCAYGGTSMLTGNTGTYDNVTMKPSTGVLKWGATSPYYLAMIDRIKYSLSLNEDNRFLGVVWMQGENDMTNPTGHFAEFELMYNQFVTDMTPLASKTVSGQIGKHLWYNVETVHYWYYQNSTIALWDNYRRWNKETYVEISRKADSNAINGTGSTSSTRQAHFGNNAYSKFVAPAIYQKMIENGFIVGDTEVTSLETEKMEKLVPVTADDFYIDINNNNNSISVTDDGRVVYAINPSYPDRNNTFIKGDFEILEFDVTRTFYYMSFAGNKTGSPSLSYYLAMGLTNNNRNNILELGEGITSLSVNLSSVDMGLDVALVDGDRIRVIRTDRQFNILKWDNTLNDWRRLKGITYGLYDFIENCNDFEIGFSTGISNGELLSPYDLRTLAKNMKIYRGKYQNPINLERIDAELSFVSKKNTIAYASTTHLFNAEAGTATEQGFTQTATNGATVTYVDDVVDGISRRVVRLVDTVPTGAASVERTITDEEVTVMQANSSVFYGVSKIEAGATLGFNTLIQHGTNGYGCHFNSSSGKVQLSITAPTITNIVLDGTGGKPDVLLDQWFNWKIEIDQLGQGGRFYINSILVGNIPYTTTGEVAGNRFSLNTGAVAGTGRSSRHSLFSLVIMKEQINKTLLSNDFIGFDDVQIIVPDAPLDFSLTIDPTVTGRSLGDKLGIALNNVGANFTILGNESFLLNGVRSSTFNVTSPTLLNGINIHDNKNNYILTSSQYITTSI